MPYAFPNVCLGLRVGKLGMFDIKQVIEGSELGQVFVEEVTTWENIKMSISSSILLCQKSSGFARFTF